MNRQVTGEEMRTKKVRGCVITLAVVIVLIVCACQFVVSWALYLHKAMPRWAKWE